MRTCLQDLSEKKAILLTIFSCHRIDNFKANNLPVDAIDEPQLNKQAETNEYKMPHKHISYGHGLLVTASIPCHRRPFKRRIQNESSLKEPRALQECESRAAVSEQHLIGPGYLERTANHNRVDGVDEKRVQANVEW